MQLGQLHPADRTALREMLIATARFAENEIDVALELFDLGVGDGATAPPDPTYLWVGARVADRLAGAACYGPTPATEGTFDLYWIFVHPDASGTGTGSALLGEVEKRVRDCGGRLLVVETSGRDDYDAARGFYLRRGYLLAGRVSDFYAVGDDRLILTRRLAETLAEPMPDG